MKKLLTLGLAVLVVSSLILSGCSKKEPNQNITNSEEVDLIEEDEESEGVSVDKNILTIDITFPEEIVGDTSSFNEKEYLEQNEGMKSAKVNEDGSLTLTMTKKKHNELLDEMKLNMDDTFRELIEGKDTPYIKNIEHTGDYREVRVMVDKEPYVESFDFTPYVIGVSAGMYQLYAGEEYKSTIIMEDAETGEEIYSVVYPDEFEE
jgi:major membrane immunogen (membrane-anchored lipoprotein)